MKSRMDALLPLGRSLFAFVSACSIAVYLLGVARFAAGQTASGPATAASGSARPTSIGPTSTGTASAGPTSTGPTSTGTNASAPIRTAQFPTGSISAGQNLPLAAVAQAKPETVTSEILERREKDVRQAKDLDEATRTKILDLYRQAADALKSASEFAAKAAESKRAAGKAVQAAKETRAELKRLRDSVDSATTANPTPAPNDHPLSVLETMVLEARGGLDSLRKEQVELEKEPGRRANRRKEIRPVFMAASDLAVDLKKQLLAAAPKDECPALTIARRTLLQAQLQLLDQQVPALQAELARYDAEEAVELVRLSRDLLGQKILLQERRVKQLTDSLDQIRRVEADRALAEAVLMERQRQVETNPVLLKYATDNTDLAKEALSLTKRIERAEQDLKHANAELERLTAQFTKTKEKAEGVGLTGSIGQLLRKQRAALDDPLVYQRGVDAGSRTIDEIQFRLYELDENRSILTNPHPIIRDVLENAPEKLSVAQRHILEKAAHEVLEREQQSLDALTRNYSDYYDTLLELVTTQRKLIDVLNQYADYIDERVLWIRSSRPLSLSHAFRGKTFVWLARFDNWRQVGRALWADVHANPLSLPGFLLLAGLLWSVRRRFINQIGKLGHEAHRANFTSFVPTLRAFMLTLTTSLFGAGILAYVAWRLARAAYDEDFPSAVSDALFASAQLYLPLDVVRRSCRQEGLAEAHFGWSAPTVKTVAWDVRWLMAIGLPVTFVTELLHAADPDSMRNALERFLFTAGMVLISVFIYRVLRPHTGVLRELVPSEHDDWAERLQFGCRWVGVGGALALAALVVAGYDYTARQFVWRIYLTGAALLSAYYAWAILLRWILIHRRLMGMKQVKERRVTELRSTVAADISVVASVVAEPVQKTDLAALSAQTRTLVNVGILSSLFVGCWWIWLDVFPSLGILNQWVLWTTSVGDKEIPITFAHLLTACAVLALTWIAARNIPGLLEMTVLERLPMDNAGRFAISTLARYTIVIIGLASATSTIGIGWSKIQWLATALTFGLAFGLQEIFANFIAGLIILFERPVRVGDMVTIDDVTGLVTRIRTRATTITNSDRKEFIVPNKEFITGRLLNWTLSDTINRIVINVGIAYGSDTELARELLLKAAHDHPAVLRDPRPSASFEEFGEASLKLVLRCFLPNLSERTTVIHELHTAINKSLAAHGIEIPTPQPDANSKPTLPLVGSAKPGSPAELSGRTDGARIGNEPEAA